MTTLNDEQSDSDLALPGDDLTLLHARAQAYRARHGDSALLAYAGRGSRFLCKHADAQRVVLMELHTHKEVELTPEEFKADGFFMYFIDEAAFYFGPESAKAATNDELTAQMAAMNLCIEQDEQADKGAAAPN